MKRTLQKLAGQEIPDVGSSQILAPSLPTQRLFCLCFEHLVAKRKMEPKNIPQIPPKRPGETNRPEKPRGRETERPVRVVPRRRSNGGSTVGWDEIAQNLQLLFRVFQADFGFDSDLLFIFTVRIQSPPCSGLFGGGKGQNMVRRCGKVSHPKEKAEPGLHGGRGRDRGHLWGLRRPRTLAYFLSSLCGLGRHCTLHVIPAPDLLKDEEHA